MSDETQTTQDNEQELFEQVKRRVMKFIIDNDFISLREVRTVYRFKEEEQSVIDRVMNDEDVKREMDRRNVLLLVDLRRAMMSKAREGDAKAAKMLYSLVGDEESLARINGGGVKLVDIRAVGQGRGKIIIAPAGVEDATIIDDNNPALQGRKMLNMATDNNGTRQG
jgi:hypothetical protein